MLTTKIFFSRIIKDFKSKELMPLKLIFFVQASTLYVLYPYLTIHMRELGINVEETAIMSSITPLVAMVMPPLAGMLADRIGNFRILLSLFSAFGGLAALLLLLVPIGRVTVHFPQRIIMDLGCEGRNGSLLHTMSQIHPCETKLESEEIAVNVESCGFVCHVETNNETDGSQILKSRLYTVRHLNFQTGVNTSYKYIVAPSDLATLQSIQQEDMKEHRQLKNNEFFKTSIRQVSKTNYFFPTDQLFSFSCMPLSGHVQDIDNFTTETSYRMSRNYTSCVFDNLMKSKDNINRTINYHLYKSKIKSLKPDEDDLQEEQQRYLSEKISWAGEDFRKPICDDLESNINNQITIQVRLYDHEANLEATNRVLNINECRKKCIVTLPRNAVCSNMNMEVEYNVKLTFWLYLVIRVFVGIIGGTTFAMFEGAVIAILREQEADYGLQRIYGSIGGMISSPLSGLLIDYASKGKGYTDFRPAFYLYAALKLASGVLMLLINLEFKAPAKDVVRDVFTVLRNLETAVLFLACFVLGTAWGYIESFLFWLIQDLGGSRSLMGITVAVGGIAGIPLLALSGPIISKIGHANVLFIGFVFYAIRLCGYSLIYDPWLTLIFEALESVTTSLSFTAAVTYAAKLSTTSTDSSIQGLLGGVYYGVGKGSGSLIGGYLMKFFGTRPTYQIFAVVTLLTGIIYFIFNVTYLKKRSQLEGNDIVKKKPKNIDEQDNPEKHTNDISLDEKPQSNQINNKSNMMANDNKGFLKEESHNNKQTDELNSTEIEAIRNAKNIDEIQLENIRTN
ncbi:PREDICTED: major facilitator superfamily domain-containing protein 6 isoform X1 [Trachymyrmex cornetzi]|uniref:major facilitator superfamily domain-containing protein 6 isoform X1 n=1 Tax=Trachymyrmex cornetzi TaxID=471704 RepID=UPI00084F63B2|nr:PREDICTED: major facilitator superfamily domain-containing protein 6 isoform X1 [Trachymyrmex cornetzi]